MAIKRSTAHRIRLKNIVNSPYEKREGFNPSVIKFNNLEISRVNVIASIVGKYLTDDQNYCAITLDDGSETIRVKNFGAEVGIIKELNVEGNIITSEDVGAVPTTSTNLKHIDVCFEGVS